jgi:hypothetical protein
MKIQNKLQRIGLLIFLACAFSRVERVVEGVDFNDPGYLILTLVGIIGMTMFAFLGNEK